VFKGEMSLIGPRPLLPRYLPYYTDEEMHRHDVRPGITGWAQVNGRSHDTWEQKFEKDIYYVENLSFLLDCKILFLTIMNVLGSKDIDVAPFGEFLDEERKTKDNEKEAN
ncbi:MAG: sugar transferase, partial [Muribaculaceae bacterium]|nr:sugar transferase [Muribaculaceae bacterium]